MGDFHNLLARQLKKHGIAADARPPEDQEFLRAVDAAYRQADEERALLERSLDLTSQEMLRDLDALGRAKESLFESQRFLERAQEVASVGSWSTPLRGGGVLMSKECCRILGLTPGEPLTIETFNELVHPDDRSAYLLARESAIRGETVYELQYRIKRSDGAVRWVHSKADVVRDEAGTAVKLIGIIQDISERRELEDKLRQSQKMEAVGRLAGGIAHDFNNILTAIKGYSSFLKTAVEKDGEPYRDVVEIEKAAERAAALTRQLLAFSRKQLLKPEVLDVNSVIAGLESMMRLLIRADIELVTRLGPSLGRVKADPGQISQVVMNLIVNGRDAMPDGGKLVIDTRDVVSGDSPLGVASVLISVADEGVGMDEAVLSRVFEPFFTTKLQGQGTGLGLSTVYGIVSQSGGHIGVESAPGKGTRFIIHLPRLEDGAEPKAPASASTSVESDLRGSETILVVEDEDGVRDMIVRTLREQGYSVLAGAGGEAALRLFEDHRETIRAVVTDIIMPGMNGSTLAERIKAMKPGIRILYMSGYTDDVIGHHGVLEAGTPFLQKPFTPRALAEKLRELLACALA